MNDYAQIRLMAWWYRRLVAFTRIIDRLNTTNQPVFEVVNEGIRRACKEAIDYSVEITPTEEVAVVIYDAEGQKVS